MTRYPIQTQWRDWASSFKDRPPFIPSGKGREKLSVMGLSDSEEEELRAAVAALGDPDARQVA